MIRKPLRPLARVIDARAKGENPDTLPFVEDLSGPGQFSKLIALLERRGHKAARIEKIMGQNFVRYARDMWGA